MNEQGSYDGFSPTAYGAAPPVTAAPGATAPPPPVLRPLSTGEVLDRTLAVYRRNFWLFAGIAMLPAGLLTLTSMVRMIFVKTVHTPAVAQAGAPTDVFARAMSETVLMQTYFLPATILFIIAYGISHAATVHAVLQISTGFTTSAASAYRAVRARWLRWVGIALRQFWSVLWPMLPGLVLMMGGLVATSRAKATGSFAFAGLLLLLSLLLFTAGVVLGIINFLRATLAMPAGVQEHLGVSAAMRRSRALVDGRKGRIFLALLLVYVLQVVAGSVQLPLVFLALRAHGAQQVLLEAIELLVQFVATTLVSPVASIALCLFYVDERVRREGYDIELLMQRSFVPPAAAEAQAQPSL